MVEDPFFRLLQPFRNNFFRNKETFFDFFFIKKTIENKKKQTKKKSKYLENKKVSVTGALLKINYSKYYKDLNILSLLEKIFVEFFF